ncbi:MAG: Crp/Fnr family transcriptional regulator [Dissulfurispiraceae bacterium]
MKRQHTPTKSKAATHPKVRELRDSAPLCSFTSSIQYKESQGWGPSQAYQHGVQLFHQRAEANIIFLIEKGLVKLVCDDDEGNDVLIGLRRRDWLLGIISVLLKRPHVTTAVTLTPCTLRSISAKQFLDLLTKDSQFSLHINRLLSQELCKQIVDMVSAKSTPAEARLKSLFRELIMEHGFTEGDRTVNLEVPLKHMDIARMIQVTPEHLCRLLRRLCTDGCMKRSKQTLTITSPHVFLSTHAC